MVEEAFQSLIEQIIVGDLGEDEENLRAVFFAAVHWTHSVLSSDNCEQIGSEIREYAESVYTRFNGTKKWG